MSTLPSTNSKLADDMREIARRARHVRDAECTRRKERDRATRGIYLRKRAPGRAAGMYDHCIEKIREASADGSHSITEVWSDDKTNRQAVDMAAKRLREEGGFHVEWKPSTDTGRDGFGERPVITIEISWY